MSELFAGMIFVILFPFVVFWLIRAIKGIL